MHTHSGIRTKGEMQNFSILRRRRVQFRYRRNVSRHNRNISNAAAATVTILRFNVVQNLTSYLSFSIFVNSTRSRDSILVIFGGKNVISTLNSD